MAPDAVSWAMRILIPYQEPTSRAEVTPDMRARRALLVALRVNMSAVSSSRCCIFVMLSAPPSPVKCSWQSIIPGMRVRPAPSMSSWCRCLRGRPVSSPIQLMTTLVASRLTLGTGSAPVPSISLTFRMTTFTLSHLPPTLDQSQATSIQSKSKCQDRGDASWLWRPGTVKRRLMVVPAVLRCAS